VLGQLGYGDVGLFGSFSAEVFFFLLFSCWFAALFGA